ncbi:hypothetical protein BDV18DRAFT_123111 [Aspergillus unguis]
MKESLFLLLPAELRLQIYSYILDIPTPYTALTQSKKPLVVITDTGNKYTTRGIYRALHISPKWVSANDNISNTAISRRGKKLSLLSVNHQIHSEAEPFLYTSHTLFFLNGFDPEYLAEFLDSLSPTARQCIRSIGFEICLYVHGDGCESENAVPKRSFRQYERAAKVIREKLPGLRSVSFYLDPWFAGWCDERSVLDRGVSFLVKAFGDIGGEKHVQMDFLPEAVMSSRRAEIDGRQVVRVG